MSSFMMERTLVSLDTCHRERNILCFFMKIIVIMMILMSVMVIHDRQRDLISLGHNPCHTNNRADCTVEQNRQKEGGKKEQLEKNGGTLLHFSILLSFPAMRGRDP